MMKRDPINSPQGVRRISRDAEGPELQKFGGTAVAWAVPSNGLADLILAKSAYDLKCAQVVHEKLVAVVNWY